MSRLSKAQRDRLRRKYDGHCAYCGMPLPDRWHGDHLDPVVPAVETKRTADGQWKLVSGPSRHPKRDVESNYMPSCPPCNISKGQMSLEQWRQALMKHVSSLNAYHPIYRLAKCYGLIEETGVPVVFYFERVAARAAVSGELQ
ncbi:MULTISPECIES: HNH endonuclease signature motif containing protein [Burkholderia cepacia complex]|uniref:HNH endonuclease signature motif containing protein n=1 Tax=Burkholderia cepacia complex TaxID=87882 RepID=UPI001902C481|nr:MULTISPECIES: HNH endonuclease signature motif containing protein [Burkholderia cepacia complex]MBK1824312.1 HNH endonuclease [Burkholderia orbicola]